MVYIFFDKKIAGSAIKNEIMQNYELSEELHKPVMRKFEKRRRHSRFIDNIWGTGLADFVLKEFVFCCGLLLFIF